MAQIKNPSAPLMKIMSDSLLPGLDRSLKAPEDAGLIRQISIFV
jgi:hypothetical protein